MRHLRKYEEHSDFANDLENGVFEEINPYLAYCNDDDLCHLPMPEITADVIAKYIILDEQIGKELAIAGIAYMDGGENHIENIAYYRVDGGKWLVPHNATFDFDGNGEIDGEEIEMPMISHVFTTEGERYVDEESFRWFVQEEIGVEIPNDAVITEEYIIDFILREMYLNNLDVEFPSDVLLTKDYFYDLNLKLNFSDACEELGITNDMIITREMLREILIEKDYVVEGMTVDEMLSDVDYTYMEMVSSLSIFIQELHTVEYALKDKTDVGYFLWGQNEECGQAAILTSVEIKEGVLEIPTSCFSFSHSLRNVTISSSVTSIGDGAFDSCDSLTSVTFAEDSQLTSIGNSAFNFCTILTSIEIPSGVTSISNNTFMDCESLTSVTIPSSVTSIGHGAFNYCTSLTSIDIPSGVTSISEDAFSYCSGLTNVTFAENSQLTSIGGWAFYDCTSLTSVRIPSSVATIGDRAFYRCSGLTSIEIPSSVTSIGSYAFYLCSGLTSVTYKGVTYNNSFELFNALDVNGVHFTKCDIFHHTDFGIDC